MQADGALLRAVLCSNPSQHVRAPSFFQCEALISCRCISKMNTHCDIFIYSRWPMFFWKNCFFCFDEKLQYLNKKTPAKTVISCGSRNILPQYLFYNITGNTKFCIQLSKEQVLRCMFRKPQCFVYRSPESNSCACSSTSF